jgi:hypothetical protein
MREIGVPFKPGMALANLSGRKTQTRRLVSSPKWSLLDGGPCRKAVWDGLLWDTAVFGPLFVSGQVEPFLLVTDAEDRLRRITPRYRVGDRFWQREGHKLWCPEEDCWHVRYQADGSVAALPCDWDEGPNYMTPTDAGCADEPSRWRPSIQMPRMASRCLLEITDVRGQMIQEISEEDAMAEGVVPLQMDAGSFLPRFEGLWDSINGPRGAGWGSNPPVWAFSYRLVATEPTTTATG